MTKNRYHKPGVWEVARKNENPKKRIATPTCKGGVSPTIRARYEDVVCPSCILDTGHYPATAIIEVWKRRKYFGNNEKD